MRLKWCSGYKGWNSDPIDNNSEDLFDVDELRRPLNSNRKRFTEVPNDAEFRDLTDFPKLTRPSSTSLPRLKRPYIYREIGK
jgi:hypothetical protein